MVTITSYGNTLPVLTPNPLNAGIPIDVDPNAFVGRDALIAETSHLMEHCHGNPPHPGVERVCLPSDSAAANEKARRSPEEVTFAPEMISGLRDVGPHFGLTFELFQ